jgi:hypothetical protein
VHARITQLEIDTMRITVDAATEVFEREVLPQLRAQPGFLGVYVMSTPEGKATLLSFWERRDQADSSGDHGWYTDVLADYMTLFRSPPGREHYEVRVAVPPVLAEPRT